jgi:hypothetical protein
MQLFVITFSVHKDYFENRYFLVQYGKKSIRIYHVSITAYRAASGNIKMTIGLAVNVIECHETKSGLVSDRYLPTVNLIFHWFYLVF